MTERMQITRLGFEGTAERPFPSSRLVTAPAGTQVHVAGTVGADPSRRLPPSMREQTQLAVDWLRHSLASVGATTGGIVSMTIYTVDLVALREEAQDLLDALLVEARPALSVIEVPRLADPGYRVEIEATAVLPAAAADDGTRVTAHAGARGAGIERRNPVGMYPPARNTYSQVVVAGAGRSLHLGGLTGMDEHGALRREDGMRAQASRLLDNLRAALQTQGAAFEHVVRIVIYTVAMDDFRTDAVPIIYGAFEADKPASTLLQVAALADPQALLELQVTAVL